MYVDTYCDLDNDTVRSMQVDTYCDLLDHDTVRSMWWIPTVLFGIITPYVLVCGYLL